MKLRWWLGSAVLAFGCGGPTPIKAEGAQAQGLTACGGSLSLLGDWEKERPGELVARAPIVTIDRIEHGIRVGLGEERSFVIGLDRSLAVPIIVGDELDVTITCEPVGRDTLGCHGTVLGSSGEVIAFDQGAPKDWKILRGPLLERRTHPNYGPTTIYGLQVTYEGSSVTTPVRGCVELASTSGTFRVSGTEVEHADPRAPDSADTFSYSVVRATAE